MLQAQTPALPQTFDDFQVWEPEDGVKYEWNDGDVIRFSGLKPKHYFIYAALNKLFITKGCHEGGTLMAEPDVMLTGIQMRRPDIAYFTNKQVERGRQGDDVIPEFVIEVISETDQAYRIEEKLTEYFGAGVKVVWNIIPEQEVVYV